MGVQHGALAVLNVCEVLKGTSVKTNMLASLGDSLFVEMSEHLELEETFSNVRLRHEVDLEELSLEMSLVGQVALESLKQESCSFSNSAELEEDLKDSFDGRLGVALSISGSDHFGEVASSLWVLGDHLAHNLDPVWLVGSLLAVRKDLVKLSGLDKALDDFIGGS